MLGIDDAFMIAALVSSISSGVAAMTQKEPKILRSAQDKYFEQRMRVGGALVKKKKEVDKFMKVFLQPTSSYKQEAPDIMSRSGVEPTVPNKLRTEPSIVRTVYDYKTKQTKNIYDQGSQYTNPAFQKEWKDFIVNTNFNYREAAVLEAGGTLNKPVSPYAKGGENK